MAATASVPFYLHVCSSNCCPPDGGATKVFGQEYPTDFRGKVEVDARIEKNVLRFSIPEFHDIEPQLGEAAEIDAVAIRVCDGDVSVQAIYKTSEMTALAACCHAGGCRCYAGSCAC